MKLKRRGHIDESDTQSSSAAFDAHSYAEIRRSRVVQCRDHRDRYLAQRGLRTESVRPLHEASSNGWRCLPVAMVALFLGTITLSAVFDALHLIRGGGSWLTLSYWGLGLGSIVGLVAAAASAMLWWSTPAGSSARGVSATLAMSSVVIVLLASGSRWTRPDPLTEPGVTALLLGFMAAGVAVVAGGIAGELIGFRTGQPQVDVVQVRRKRHASQYDGVDDEPESIAARA